MKEYHLVDSLEWEQFDDEVVVVNLKKGVYYRFNQTASFIWLLLVEKKGLKEIVAEIADRYEVSLELAKKDLFSFLNQLQMEKLLTIN